MGILSVHLRVCTRVHVSVGTYTEIQGYSLLETHRTRKSRYINGPNTIVPPKLSYIHDLFT